MKNVEPGWAGPGSCPPVKEAVDATVELIKRLRNLPFPIPMASVGADGRTGLFWSDEKLYADIEILEDGKVGYLIEVKGRPQVDNEEDMPDVGLPEGVAWALASAYLNNRK
ncbi:MAG: hypothetical protein K0S66_1509 [Sphingomonas sp.]|nr:hypothetical protein [Sphingomonas sp.]